MEVDALIPAGTKHLRFKTVYTGGYDNGSCLFFNTYCILIPWLIYIILRTGHVWGLALYNLWVETNIIKKTKAIK